MPTTALQRRIARKDSNKESIAARLVAAPELIPDVLEGLEADEARVRFGCAKVLRLVSELEPAVLYPHMRAFVRLLDHENTILRWHGIQVIAELARVDVGNEFDRIFDKYFEPVAGPVLVTAANLIKGGGKIALAKPRLADRIAGEILKAERGRYRTAACRHVACGEAIKAFDRCFDRIDERAPVVRMVRRQLASPRAATRKAAERFLRKHVPDSAREAAGRRSGRADG